MPITFHKEEVEFQMPQEEMLIDWLEGIVSSVNRTIVQITFIFCSDEFLLGVNKEYLNHDYYTDIITFPYKQGKEIESDIFISIDRIKENASTFSTSFERELLRVMAHGVLHLIGFKDNTEEESREMREKEEWAIDLYYSNK